MTLLLRFEGPMQSWGTTSRFTERDTALEPSKSGVIGLLCAALGKPRVEEAESDRWPLLKSLSELHMGVRVDRPGSVSVDFQTAGGGRFGTVKYGVAKADGSKPETVMSWRYYLQDAAFLVGLQGDPDLLRHLHQAVEDPVWPLSLGRKSYVPSVPVYLSDGLRETDLLESFSVYPPLDVTEGDPSSSFKVVVDHPSPVGAEARVDVPLDFARRRFALRYVRVFSIPAPERCA